MFKNYFANQSDKLENAGDMNANEARQSQRTRNIEQQGRQGNIEQNTHNQGYQQDR